MAIDYREEWGKLINKHGHRKIESDVGIVQRLGSLMYDQIERTVSKREKLMDEYVKTRIHTEIIGGDQHCHKVKLIVRGESRGTIPVGKDAFQAWIKREKGGKCDQLL